MSADISSTEQTPYSAMMTQTTTLCADRCVLQQTNKKVTSCHGAYLLMSLISQSLEKNYHQGVKCYPLCYDSVKRYTL